MFASLYHTYPLLRTIKRIQCEVDPPYGFCYVGKKSRLLQQSRTVREEERRVKNNENIEQNI